MTTGDDNTFMGGYPGRYVTTGNKNISIGYKSGPGNGSNGITNNNSLYIDTLGTYSGTESLIYGDQSMATPTLSLNAEVTVRGGALKIWGQGKISGNTNGKVWSISVPNNTDTGSSVDRNLVISNRSVSSLTGGDTNIIIGSAGSDYSLTNGDSNIIFGYEWAYQLRLVMKIF